MANKRQLTDQYGEPLPAGMSAHILALDFKDYWLYRRWCAQNRLDGNVASKSRKQMLGELALREAERERARFLATIDRKPKAFIEAVCRGELRANDVSRRGYAQAAAAIEASNPDHLGSLEETLTGLLSHGDAIFELIGPEENSVVTGIVKLHDRKALWLRPIEEFKPRSRSRNRWFGELTHHLLDRHGDVPMFMEAVWLRTDPKSWRYRDWYVHLGRGFNLRTAKAPLPVTKKIAHWFMRAPSDVTPEQALRFGQMTALGATGAATTALLGSRLGREFAHEDFWLTFMRWLVANPMLDPRQIAPLIDYVHNQRFVAEEIEIEWGEIERRPPAQPNLTMRGRSATTLLREMERWHHELGFLEIDHRDSRGGAYPKASFDGIAVRSGGTERTLVRAIRQIRSFGDLVQEGQVLRHCVASYHESVIEGHCTMWSMSTDTGSGAERVQTIEVDRFGGIVQCRGKANSEPDAAELKLLHHWADARGLHVASYF